LAYPARTAYRASSDVADYEAVRFGGLLGRYRWRREQLGIACILSFLPSDLSVLDCPCGTGRWLPPLSSIASSMCAADISPTMLQAARVRELGSAAVDFVEAEAEHLPFSDRAFDLVFSHALTKHLPPPVQHEVLSEFGRVSRQWVVCSFSIAGPLVFSTWRRRRLVAPITLERLDDMASGCGLERVRMRRCTSPIGVEHSVLFRRKDAEE